MFQMCDGDMVKAHKLVLSACSHVFKDMLKKNTHPHAMIFLRGYVISVKCIQKLNKLMLT